MITPTTVSESFIDWMEDNSYGTFGTDIFLNQIPDDAPDNAYWIVTAGGDLPNRLVTAQSIQSFTTQVFYRSASGADVEHKLFALNQKVNTHGYFTIDGFNLFDIQATMPEDNDRDAENRRQGSFTVDSKIYVNYVS